MLRGGILSDDISTTNSVVITVSMVPTDLLSLSWPPSPGADCVVLDVIGRHPPSN